MWKIVSDSVRGTSHKANRSPCQDYSQSCELTLNNECVLVASVADGAGSAAYSDRGARVACETFVKLVVSQRASHDLWPPTPSLLMEWLEKVQDTIVIEAAELEVGSRELATTFLGAIVGESWAGFLQIGDGAIIAGDGKHYRTVFWPQSGEYANTTNFLTDSAFRTHAVIEISSDQIQQLAMFTDGIERLVLNFQEREVHRPFLRPLFNSLCSTEDPNTLVEPLRSFLDSPQVNARTDDDKTLLLATRRD